MGRDFLIGFRISGDEHIEEGFNLDDAKKIVKVLEEASVDYIHLSSGRYEAVEWASPDKEGGDATQSKSPLELLRELDGVFGLEEASPKLLVEAEIQEIEETEKVVKTNCFECHTKCGVLVHTREGKVVKIEGNPEHPYTKGAMCSKGLAAAQLIYHPDRLKYPLKRMGERGEGEWVRTTWEEALETISKVCGLWSRDWSGDQSMDESD